MRLRNSHLGCGSTRIQKTVLTKASTIDTSNQKQTSERKHKNTKTTRKIDHAHIGPKNFFIQPDYKFKKNNEVNEHKE